MRSPVARSLSKCILTLILFIAIVHAAMAVATADIRVDETSRRDQESKTVFSLLSQMNHHSPIEGAGSHGSYGTSVGMGMVSTATDNNSQTHAQVFNQKTALEEENLNMPKIFLVKGTTLPLDFGLSFGNVAASSVQQISAHLQWTFIEGLGIPAIAARVFFSKFSGLQYTEFSSAGVDLMASYGFLRYFAIYAGTGVQHNDAYIYIPASDATFDYETKRNFITQNSIVGLSVTFLPPYAKASAEVLASTTGFKSVAGKINVQI